MLGKITKIQYKKSRPNRSYAFVRGTDENDYWFCLKGISETLHEGDKVVFEGEENEKGYIARDVRVVT